MAHNSIVWTSGNLITNPAAGTILVQTEPLSSPGVHEVSVMVYSNSPCLVSLQRIEDDGTTVLNSQRFGVSTSVVERLDSLCIVINKVSQRLRIIADESIVGEVQASIY